MAKKKGALAKVQDQAINLITSPEGVAGAGMIAADALSGMMMGYKGEPSVLSDTQRAKLSTMVPEPVVDAATDIRFVSALALTGGLPAINHGLGMVGKKGIKVSSKRQKQMTGLAIGMVASMLGEQAYKVGQKAAIKGSEMWQERQSAELTSEEAEAAGLVQVGSVRSKQRRLDRINKRMERLEGRKAKVAAKLSAKQGGAQSQYGLTQYNIPSQRRQIGTQPQGSRLDRIEAQLAQITAAMQSRQPVMPRRY